jgi:Spy/CpxP family protein refolding chaperone
MKSIKMVLLLAVSMLTLGALAQQNPPPPGPPGGGRGPVSVDDQVKNLTERLNLTADQQAKIKPILEDNRSQIMKVMQDDSMSREDKMAKGRGIREATNGKIRELLTDDQKKQFDDMLERQRQRQQQQQQGGGAPPKP